MSFDRFRVAQKEAICIRQSDFIHERVAYEAEITRQWQRAIFCNGKVLVGKNESWRNLAPNS